MTPESPPGCDLGPAAAAGDGDALGEVLGRAVVAAVQVDDPAYDGLGAEVALADGGVERRDVGELEVDRGQHQRLVGHQPLERQPLLAHQLGDLLLALVDRLLAPLLGEPLADLGAGARRLHEAEPVARRAGGRRLGGEDLDRRRRSRASDSSGTSRPLTRAPMVWWPTSVCTAYAKSTGVAPVGQRDHVAARGEDVDLGPVDLEAQRLQELARVLDLVLPVEQLAHPGHVVDVAGPVGVDARRGRPPCTSSAPRRRTRRGGASRRSGSAARPACPAGRSPSCAATGTC